MKIVLKIAKFELISMFSSPVAWVIIIMLSLQTGFAYTAAFESVFARQVMHYTNWDISRSLFSFGPSGVFPAVQQYLYLYIPLITMGLMSQETSSGTIKLLYSSPILSRQIIGGKYIAMIIYGAVLIGVLLVPVVFSAFTVDHFDWPPVLTGLLATFLLICTYAAIGLFISCLTASQVVVAIATFVTLAALNYVNTIGQKLPFVREITFWLSIKGRADQMTQGLIGSEDLFYFLIVSGLFLVLATRYLVFGRKNRPLLVKMIAYSSIILVTITAGYLTFQPRLMFYYDSTATKVMSLKKADQAILENIKEPVTITTYVNLFDNDAISALPQNQMTDKAFFKDYIRFKPDITLKYVYYYNNPAIKDSIRLRDIARKLAIRYQTNINDYLTPKQIDKLIDLSGENYRFIRQITCASGKSAWLRMFDDDQVIPGEADIMTAFKKISVALPKVLFLSGHSERSTTQTHNRDYFYLARAKNFRNSMINLGFDVDTVLLDKHKTKLQQGALLVIADPKQPLQAWEVSQINDFIANGGNMLIAGDEGNQPILYPITKNLGITLNDGLLIQPHKDDLPDLILTKVTTNAVALNSAYSLMNKQNATIQFNGSPGLTLSNNTYFNVAPLLHTGTSESWLIKNRSNVNLKNLKPPGRNAEVAQDYLLAAALHRKLGRTDQRIVVVADADFMSNAELQNRRSTGSIMNRSFINSLFKYFSYGSIPIDISFKLGPDTHLNFSSKWIKPMHMLFWVMVPLLFLVTALTIILKRRRQ